MDVETEQNLGRSVPRDLIYSLLQDCGKKKDLAGGRRVHVLMVSSGLESVAVLADHFIRLFTSCSSLLEANLVFCKVAKPSSHTWHAIIAAHSIRGNTERALELYCKMQHADVTPSKPVLLCLLKACGSVGSLEQGKLVHGQIICSGLDSDVSLGNTLIDMYAKCSRIEEGHKMFDELPTRDVVSWNVLITGYAQNGHGLVALELFEQMQEDGIKPDKVTFSCAFNACGTLKALEQGKLIHEQLRRSGIKSDVIMGNSLIDMYAKCGSLEEACRLFEQLPDRDVVSWGAMIAGYALNGHAFSALKLFEKMQQERMVPDKASYLSILKACNSLGATEQGRLIHQQILECGVESDVVMGSTLIDMYAKFGNLEEACEVFYDLPYRNAVSWNAIIAGYAQHGHGFHTLELFERMQYEGIKPDKVTVLYILKACGSLDLLEQGKLIHNQVIMMELESDVLVGGTLIDMYMKCGSLNEAHKVFDGLPDQNVHSWNAIIAGYAQHGHGLVALKLLEKMQQKGMQPDKVTFSCVFKACATMGAAVEGKGVHDQIIRTGVEADMVVGNSLIDMYAKFGNLDSAHQVFEEMLDRDVVSWNTMIAGYAWHGLGFLAIELYEKLLQEGIMPDKVTFLCALKACSDVGAIKQGKLIHDRVVKCGLELDIVIGSTLVDMYAKCGTLKDASEVFSKMPTRNVVSWGAMIGGFALYGNLRLAEQWLQDMQQKGLKPDGRIYTSILAACSHAGLVEEGYQYFKSLREEHGLTPSMEHFNCMIDLLSRAGRLFEAEKLLCCMPISPDITGWTSLLTACRVYGDRELGKHCFDQVVHLDPDMAAGYVTISNIFADADMWDDVHVIQELVKSTSASRKPGTAWIDIGRKVHEFVVGKKHHYHSDKIYYKLEQLKNPMKEKGYMPQLHLVWEGLTDNCKREDICLVSEKLDGAFGLPCR